MVKQLYRRPVGDDTNFDNLAEYPIEGINPAYGGPFDPGAGFEWVEGAPAEDAVPYVHKTLQQLVTEAYNAVLTAAMTAHPELVTPDLADEMMAREARIDKAWGKGEAFGVMVATKNITEMTLPAEFEPYRQQLLAQLPE